MSGSTRTSMVICRECSAALNEKLAEHVYIETASVRLKELGGVGDAYECPLSPHCIPAVMSAYTAEGGALQ